VKDKDKQARIEQIRETTAKPLHGEFVCDFCSAPATHIARCSSFEFQALPDPDDIGAYSSGDWACCEVCAAFIDRGDQEALRERALYELRQRWLFDFGELSPEAIAVISGEITVAQAQFWQHYSGEIAIMDEQERQKAIEQAKNNAASNQQIIDKLEKDDAS
jgi:hypothetical protein